MAYQEQTTSTAATEIATITLAIELSTKGWVILLTDSVERRFSRHAVAAYDWEGLLRLIERRREKLAARGGAGVFLLRSGARWILAASRVGAARGQDHVIDPASIRVERRGRRAKTDRLDVQQLLMALLAHRRGEPRACSIVRAPSEEEEDAKRPNRERQALIKERVQHVNRMKSFCALHGVRGFKPIAADRWVQLAELRRCDGTPLPPHVTATIKRELTRLELVLEQIRELERQRNAVLKQADAAPRSAAHTIKKLVRMRGIGAQTATLLTREVLYRRFDNRKQVAGYVGLGSAPFQSGTIDRDQGIAKSGNPRARTAMIELMWLWLDYQPNSAVSRWFRERVRDQRGRMRRIAIVAAARKLLVALWRYVEHDVIPAGAELKKA